MSTAVGTESVPTPPGKPSKAKYWVYGFLVLLAGWGILGYVLAKAPPGSEKFKPQNEFALGLTGGVGTDSGPTAVLTDRPPHTRPCAASPVWRTAWCGPSGPT